MLTAAHTNSCSGVHAAAAQLCAAARAYATQVGAQGAQATAAGHPCRLVLQAELRPGRVRRLYMAKAAAYSTASLTSAQSPASGPVRKTKRQHRLRRPAPQSYPQSYPVAGITASSSAQHPIWRSTFSRLSIPPGGFLCLHSFTAMALAKFKSLPTSNTSATPTAVLLPCTHFTSGACRPVLVQM